MAKKKKRPRAIRRAQQKAERTAKYKPKTTLSKDGEQGLLSKTQRFLKSVQDHPIITLATLVLLFFGIKEIVRPKKVATESYVDSRMELVEQRLTANISKAFSDQIDSLLLVIEKLNPISSGEGIIDGPKYPIKNEYFVIKPSKNIADLQYLYYSPWHLHDFYDAITPDQNLALDPNYQLKGADYKTFARLLEIDNIDEKFKRDILHNVLFDFIEDESVIKLMRFRLESYADIRESFESGKVISSGIMQIRRKQTDKENSSSAKFPFIIREVDDRLYIDYFKGDFRVTNNIVIPKKIHVNSQNILAFNYGPNSEYKFPTLFYSYYFSVRDERNGKIVQIDPDDRNSLREFLSIYFFSPELQEKHKLFK